ncbi:MAG: diiron oxygenase [Gammaproteobacteria bacterium]
MTSHMNSLARLNQLAESKGYDIEDINWNRSVDRELLWGPEALGPLTYLPAYTRLNAIEKRRLNQLFSMGVCEQFVWLEENILVKTLSKVLTKWHFDADFTEAIHHFIDEEKKHTEMFWRVLEKSEPEWYRQRQFKLFNTSKLQTWFINRVVNHPTVLLVWLWMAIFFEEKTVSYCQHYQRAQKQNPDTMDALYRDLHHYHFLDEARHFQLDEYLLSECYAKQASWKQRLSGHMFTKIMKSYISPQRTSRQILKVMATEFPHLQQSVIPEFMEQLPTLANNQAFQTMAFSNDAVPKALAIFKRYPELDGLWDLFCIDV